MRPAPLILLGVLCDDGFTVTLDQQEIMVQKNRKNIEMIHEQTNSNMEIFPGDLTIRNCGK